MREVITYLPVVIECSSCQLTESVRALLCCAISLPVVVRELLCSSKFICSCKGMQCSNVFLLLL